jgi:hypothetical protein
MDMINGKPVKAFIYQDHEAHITVHMAAAQDPKIAQLIGQSPNARNVQAALAAHIQEHLAFEYRKQIEEAAGVPYPAPDSEMSEDTEVQISRLAAAAAQKDQLAVERERIAAQKEIAGAQIGAKVGSDKAKQQAEGMRIGMELAREAKQDLQPPKKENK